MNFNSVLLGLHLFSAATWFGAAFLFGIVVGPTIGDFTPTTSGEVVVKMLPKYLRFIGIFTFLTPVLGLIAGLSASNGEFGALFSPSTTSGVYMLAGGALSLFAWGVTFAVVLPTGRKIVKITREFVKNQTPQPPGLPKLAMRLKISSGIVLVLLIAILICMVAASG